ncbi:MAG: DUF115 domain-containing protein [Phycisphaerales bacterium]|nr:DUF115 domain-containing protein [Phycisphaerales bacterium]
MEAGLDPKILERNLAMIRVRSPRAAQRIMNAKTSVGFSLVETDEGVPSGALDGRALASKRRPMSEAEKFAGGYDPKQAAGACVLGFGMGHHLAALHERIGSKGVVICFEPDLGLLRAVLERVDHRAWLKKGRFLLATDPDDAAELSELLRGFEAIVSLGVQIMEHPASNARLGDARSRFAGILTNVMKAARTQVVTTLAHSPVSFRNMLMNIGHYAACPSVDELKDACPGATAVIVAAGPSLKKNLHLLKDPETRKRVVVIAVQTVLKQLLREGIRPDFVTALDYHELSKRFYEGLTAEDVRGIRLVVEPKANPAILDSFPGEIVCIEEPLLDKVLGEGLKRAMGSLPNGGTVAHLSYYLARHLGCDPVVMIGQDLGFTDGQYYGAGAAIHRVWSGELNAHNTLEMLEWQRIARMKSLLRPMTDIHGRRMFTDEQMATYLAQFEADFLRDSERGMTTIDATEGGVSKRHTTAMGLEEALADTRHGGKVSLPVSSAKSGQRINAVRDRLDAIARDAENIRAQSQETIYTLKRMIAAGGDQKKIGKLIDKVNTIRDRVVALKEAYALTEFVNQTGVLNRFRADRAIEIDSALDPIERQRKQIERDIRNVEWTRDAAAELRTQMQNARCVLMGEMPKITRDEPAEDAALGTDAVGGRVEALIFADPDYNGLGMKRDLAMIVANGLNALQITVARLLRCTNIDGVTIASTDPERVGSLLGHLNERVTLVRVDGKALRERTRLIGIGRHRARDCWRGGMGVLTCYDESLDPRLALSIMEQRSMSAAVLVGADWAMIDPTLVDEIVERHRSAPAQHRLAFSQAVPGIGGFVVDRSAIESLSNGQSNAGSFATIGGLIGYIPFAPQADPIAKAMCVQISTALRDAGVRAIADTTDRVLALAGVYEQLGTNPIDADTTASVALFSRVCAKNDRSVPAEVHLELCSGRLSNGPFGQWKRGGSESSDRAVLTLARAHGLLRELITLRPDAALVLDGAGDPLMHPDAIGFVQLADELGFASVELRTDLLCPGVDAHSMIESGLGVLSVDLLASTPETYAALTGQNMFNGVVERLEGILSARGKSSCGLAPMWVVPRITRCDATMEEIPDFYDRWLLACGCAAIDPLPRAIRGQRIQALPIPSERQRRIDARTMRVRSDGVLVDRFGRALGELDVFEAGIERAYRQSRKQVEVKCAPSNAEVAA